MKYSRNARAEKLVGKRDLPENAIPFDQPAELGYVCPICQNESYHKEIGCYDERLHWSEYNGFLWCKKCNLDIPSSFCVPYMKHKNRKKGMPWYQRHGVKDAIKIYLDCIEDIEKVKSQNERR